MTKINFLMYDIMYDEDNEHQQSATWIYVPARTTLAVYVTSYVNV